jgi:hypothetical protein
VNDQRDRFREKRDWPKLIAICFAAAVIAIALVLYYQ